MACVLQLSPRSRFTQPLGATPVPGPGSTDLSRIGRQVRQSVRMAWRTGPVAVTGASGQVGSRLLRRLDQLPNQVRPLGREDELASAFGDADAVVHLAGTLQPRKPNTYRVANLDTALATAAALARSAAQRVVFLSFLTARPDASNSYLRFKAEAEEALRSTGTPTVIFRCDHIYGPPDEPGPTALRSLRRGGESCCWAAATNSWPPCTGTM